MKNDNNSPFLDLIDAYLDDALNERDRTDFQNALDNDAALQKQVRLNIIQRDVLEAIKTQERLDKIKQWQLEPVEEKDVVMPLIFAHESNLPKVENEPKRQWRQWAVAASLTLAAGIGALVYWNNKKDLMINDTYNTRSDENVLPTSKSEKNAEINSTRSGNGSYTQSLPQMTDTKVNDATKDPRYLITLAHAEFIPPQSDTQRDSDITDSIERMIIGKDYAALYNAIDKKTTDYNLLSARAAACFMINKIDEAIEHYDTLLRNQDAAMLHEDIELNRALAFLKQTPPQYVETKKALSLIANDAKHPHTTKAQRVLKGLPKGEF